MRRLSFPASPSSAPLKCFILCAVWKSRMKLSPMRPIACESDEYIDRTPRSCSTSSAAIVSARIRLSANATSSGTPGFRWWQTISMSRCSASVFTVYGRVGLVEEGSTLGWAAIRMMSGAWPPPAPSVWYVWMVLPAIAAIVSSTNPASFSVSVWIATWTSYSSATRRLRSMTARVVPQSSWSLSPHAPASSCSRSGPGVLALPLPSRPQFTGRASPAQHLGQVPGPERAGRGGGAVGRPGAAADHRGDPAGQRRPGLLGRDHVDVAVDAPRRGHAALAGDHLGAGPDDQARRDPVHDVRVAGLADADDAAVAHAQVCLDHAEQGVQHHHVRDDQVERAVSGAGVWRLRHPVPDRLAAAEDRLLARHGQVRLHLADQVGIRQQEAVAHRGPVQLRVLSAAQPHRTAPGRRRPPNGTSRTVLASPGSKRTAVPAGISSRWPAAAARSNSSARLASAKWKWEPTWTGRSPRLTTRSVVTGRPTLISISSVGCW